MPVDLGPQVDFALLLIHELRAAGVRQFFIAPGNQSSPFAAAFALCEDVAVHYHYDERGLAFAALGYARVSQKPAAVFCTSGTAVANFFPAVLEAESAQVPLLLITADRPEELQEVGANQTMRQQGIFGEHVRWDHYFSAPPYPTELQSTLYAAARGAVDYAVHRAMQAPAGAVHLNVSFRKPFIRSSSIPSSTIEDTSRGVRTRYVATTQQVSEPEMRRIAQRLSAAKRGVICVGALSPLANRKAITDLANTLQWPLYASVLSGLRSPAFSGLYASHWYLSHPRFMQEYAPDCVLHLGDEPPKPGNAALTFFENSGAYRITVSESQRRVDPAHTLTERVCIEPSVFAAQCVQHVRAAPSQLYAPWTEAERRTRDEINKRYDGAEGSLCEVSVVRRVFRSLSAEQQLFIANSLPIRLAEFFAEGGAPEIICNRGLSGIDGGIATAWGAAQATGKLTVALIGDLSLLHDCNSLPLLVRQPVPLVLVVLNNDGGGIFAPMTKELPNERYAELMFTPHGLNFSGLSQWLGMGYHQTTSRSDFEEVFTKTLRAAKPALVEVSTNSPQQASQLAHFQSAVHAALF